MFFDISFYKILSLKILVHGNIHHLFKPGKTVLSAAKPEKIFP